MSRKNQHNYVPEPEDVDALLAESLKAQSERDFTWKEPERKPRWWERAEVQETTGGLQTRSGTGAEVTSSARSEQGLRIGSAIFALVCLVLAAWVVASVVFNLSVNPLIVGLVVCSLAGLALITAGLRRPGARI